MRHSLQTACILHELASLRAAEKHLCRRKTRGDGRIALVNDKPTVLVPLPPAAIRR
jgi:hypothetical protein